MLVIAFGLSGCSTLSSSPDYDADKPQMSRGELPENWSGVLARSTESDVTKISNLIDYKIFNNINLEKMVAKSLANNRALQQQALNVQIKEQSLIVSGSQLWPSLSAGLSARRTDNNLSIIDKFDANLSFKYEVDLWQKLSAGNQKANLEYMAEQANLEQSTQNLVANVVSTWLDVIEAKQLLSLFNKRLDNAKQNLAIIESGYQQGLNGALDVYLARNELNSEISRQSQQQLILSTTIRELERLVGEYPHGALDVSAEIPELTSSAMTNLVYGVPSELLTRKPDLKSSWYQLMAKDAGLAFAHRQRFPSFELSGTLGDSSERFSKLFSASGLAWSLLGSLTGPIFDGGRLKANEKLAEYQLQQQELQFMEDVYKAVENVENGLALQQSLEQRIIAVEKAAVNAIAAEQLAFEQYQSGLVSYTTVLDAQSRAFDAQSSLIQIKKQRVSNQVNLQVLLGGSFSNIQTKTGN